MDKLTNEDLGLWLVRTESGTIYRVSLKGKYERNTMTRLPNSTEPVPDEEGVLDRSVSMRQDTKELDLASIVKCEVGENAVFVLTGVSEHAGVVTSRRTTPIVSISAIDAD